MQLSQSLGSDGRAYGYVRDGLMNASIGYELPVGTVKTAADWRSSFSSFVGIVGEPRHNLITLRS